MLSLFPDLLFLNFFAPLILRVILGLVLIGRATAYKDLGTTSSGFISVVYFISSLFLLAGFLTQGVALLVFIITGFTALKHRDIHESDLLILGVSLVLIITGAGVLAFDLPL